MTPSQERVRIVASVSQEASAALEELAAKRFHGNRSLAVDWAATIAKTVLADKQTYEAKEPEQALDLYREHSRMELRNASGFWQELVGLLKGERTPEEMLRLKLKAASNFVAKAQEQGMNPHALTAHFAIPLTAEQRAAAEQDGFSLDVKEFAPLIRAGVFRRLLPETHGADGSNGTDASE